jgi:hypothetical protein
MPQIPRFSSARTQDGLKVSFAGSWTVDAAQVLESNAASLLTEAAGAARAIFDLGALERLDTCGAWLIDRTRQDLNVRGVETRFEHVRPKYEILLSEARYRAFPELPQKPKHLAFDIAADVGESIVSTGRDLFNATSFLGEVVVCFLKTLVAPARFRGTSVVFHIENFAFRSMPIIALINFLVGGIVAQRGIYLPQKFGAPTYAVDLVGILVLRATMMRIGRLRMSAKSRGTTRTARSGTRLPGRTHLRAFARVPIRTDTKARLESTGLTGIASVALAGGSVDAPPLAKGPNGGPGVNVAERSDFQEMMEAARHIAGQASDLLDKANKVLDDNSGSLTASVKNVKKFSDALAANSDGVKDFLAAVSDVGHSIGPLSAKLTVLADDSDKVVKAVDPDEVKSTLKDVAELAAKLPTRWMGS